MLKKLPLQKQKWNKLEKISLKENYFQRCCYKHSDDKNTKFNAGVIPAEDSSDRQEKLIFQQLLLIKLQGVNKGDLTEVFMDELNQKKSGSINENE